MTVTPATATLGPSQTQQFALKSSSTASPVVWSIDPVDLGTISSTGLYTAPNAIALAQGRGQIRRHSTTLTVTIKAAITSNQTTETATATVILDPSAPANSVTVSVSPASISLGGGQSQQFTAVVTGSSNQSVTWSINPPVGTLANGFYTAPSSIASPQTVTITAVTGADSSVMASATITLTTQPKPPPPPPAISISVAPQSASLSAGKTAQFTASVSGGNASSVVWSIAPAVGSITASGLYTAPAAISSAQTLVLTVASSADPSIRASATVSLNPPAPTPPPPPAISVSVSPSSVSLSPSQSLQFTASVTGSTNTGVTWSLKPPVGSITGAGVYSAPGSISAAQTVVVTAASSADNTKSAQATISLTPPSPSTLSIAVSPLNATLSGGDTLQFTAVVHGSKKSAAWSISPPIGSVKNGLYTAPSKVDKPQTVTVSAAVTDDGTASPMAEGILPGATSSLGATTTKTATATITLTPVSVSIAPATATLNNGQSAQFTATVNGAKRKTVTWSMSPQVGTLKNGLYTAPSTVTSIQTITITATSAADSTKSAAATVLLQPSRIWIALSPTSASLTSAQSKQFTATVNGGTNTGVMWSLSPSVGTVNNGLYTAPANVISAQTVTLTATSVADTTQTATAAISLVPTVAISVSPGSAALAGGQTAQFTATVTGTSSTGASWSISPQTGTIDGNGLYTAPAVISSQQTITVTATSLADSTKTAQASVSLTPVSVSVSPAKAVLSASQSQRFSAQVQGASNSSVMWSMNPPNGTIDNTGLYTAPGAIASAQTVTITATSVADSTKTASATVSLQPPVSGIILPVEVMGPAGTTVSVQFNIPTTANLNGQLQLWLRIHGLKYQTEASVQINGSAWIPINSTTVALQGLAGAYGGIGGGFATLKLTMNVPSGAIVPGANTLNFSFNGTDGATSGYRLLGLNILAADGTQLIPQSSFSWDDPSAWQPPLNTTADIAAGQALYTGASLTAPGMGAIQAKCSSCHAQDGRDLKYFNYSNFSIRVRSMFHGLTAQQGDQIASYIRSLNVLASVNGRPWNPPYQPGPGLDSRPVSEWAAGAGIDAVLDTDAQSQPYLAPGGSTAGWAANQVLNAREIPIALQLPDWNRWLPQVHPLDAFGSSFATSVFNTGYTALRNGLVPNSAAAYTSMVFPFQSWFEAGINFLTPLETNATWTSTLRAQIYSAAQWQLVKDWELNQEFGLEAMPQVPYGSKAELRAWYMSLAFQTSPNMQHIPPGAGLGNGLIITQKYLALIWYNLQLILNDGNGHQTDHFPVDYPYVFGFIKDISLSSNNSPDAMLGMLWLVKGLQEQTEKGVGPDKGASGWAPNSTTPEILVDQAWATMWLATPAPTRTTFMQAYLQDWFSVASSFTAQQYYTGGWASATQNPQTAAQAGDMRVFAAYVWSMLPRFRYFGVDPNLTYQLADWAATVWPAGNWSLNKSATCVASYNYNLVCTSD